MAVPERPETVQHSSDLHVHPRGVSSAADRSGSPSDSYFKLLKSAHEYIDEGDLARAIEAFPHFDPETKEGMSGLVLAAAFEKLKRSDTAMGEMAAHWLKLAEKGNTDGTDDTSDLSNGLEASQP